MFRMPPQVDPEEERKKVVADVRNNFVIFTILCAAIRIAPFLMSKMHNN